MAEKRPLSEPNRPAPPQKLAGTGPRIEPNTSPGRCPFLGRQSWILVLPLDGSAGPVAHEVRDLGQTPEKEGA